MAKIVVIEPATLMRLGLVQLVSQVAPDYSVLGLEPRQLAQEPACPSPCDLILLALNAWNELPELLAQCTRVFADTPVVLLADPGTATMADAPALTHSVVGYLNKHSPEDILMASIKLVLAGGTCFPARVKAAHPNHMALPGTEPARTCLTEAVATSGAPPIESSETRELTPSAHNPFCLLPTRPATTAQALQPTPQVRSIVEGREVSAPFSMHTVSTGTPLEATRPGDADDRQPAANNAVMNHAGEQTEWEMLGLTRRQYEVLVLLARGYPMKTVGRYLNISVATAKAHTETLYQRLDVHNRNAAVYAAVSRGATLGWPGIAHTQQLTANPSATGPAR